MTTQQREEYVKRVADVIARRDLRTDAPMSEYTTLRLGGPAQLLCEVSGVEQLIVLTTAARQMALPILVLGNGSNLLVKDGGVPGVVLHLGEKFSVVGEPVPQADGSYCITAQAGAPLVRLSNAAADAGLGGLEFAAGIPGTVGGALVMNAGAYGGEMKDVVANATVMTQTGEIKRLSAEELEFGYRSSVISRRGYIVLDATVRLMPGDADTIRTTMREFNARRRDKQPLTVPSCGSTFKRPEGAFAGTLIDECGLKGYRLGGVAVSDKHAGFLVNDQGGTAAEYLRLIEHVQGIVEARTGVRLSPEVRIVGAEPDTRD